MMTLDYYCRRWRLDNARVEGYQLPGCIFPFHTYIRQWEADLCSRTNRKAYSKTALRSAMDTKLTSCNHVMHSCCLAYLLVGELRKHFADYKYLSKER
jgi:hypothetical protein